MCSNNENKTEQASEQKTEEVRTIPCGYCGSMKPPIPYEEMYGPGAHGWDCCPDCGGV